MTTALWLADVLKAAGLTVVEHAGWKTRTAGGAWTPVIGVIHDTAAPDTSADSTQIAIVRDGRAGLPGPIANAVVDHLGRWHIIASSRCNSVLVGEPGTPYEGLGNPDALSTEATNDNVGPWLDVQYQAYVRGWAAWCAHLGWSAERLVGHKEHNPSRRNDPNFSMDEFRRDVTEMIEEMAMPTAEEIAEAVVAKGAHAIAEAVIKFDLANLDRTKFGPNSLGWSVYAIHRAVRAVYKLWPEVAANVTHDGKAIALPLVALLQTLAGRKTPPAAPTVDQVRMIVREELAAALAGGKPPA